MADTAAPRSTPMQRPCPRAWIRLCFLGKGVFNPQMGEFILDYADARASEDPVETVLAFLEETYYAAADAAKWDRAALDRSDDVADAIRLKRPQQRTVSGR